VAVRIWIANWPSDFDHFCLCFDSKEEKSISCSFHPMFFDTCSVNHGSKVSAIHKGMGLFTDPICSLDGNDC
jgi:hypothetical protein